MEIEDQEVSALIESVFFFKQKTAYEMRISDWSSDVCSSDLWADGRAGTGERELLAQWGKWLGWTPQQVQALAVDYEPHKHSLPNNGVTYQEALRLLGVSATSEPSQIKRAYRRLLSRHHPDKIAGSGATPLQVRDATDRTRERSEEHTSELQQLMRNSYA